MDKVFEGSIQSASEKLYIVWWGSDNIQQKLLTLSVVGFSIAS